MIQNERQYKVSQSKLRDLERDLTKLDAPVPNLHPRQVLARRNSARILSSVLDHLEQLGDVQGVEVLRQISPVAWQHINLYGRYEFRKFSDSIDLDSIVQQLTQAPSH